MVARLEIELGLGADLFEDHVVLFTAGWNTFNDNVFDLPDHVVQGHFGSICDLERGLYLLGQLLTGGN